MKKIIVMFCLILVGCSASFEKPEAKNKITVDKSESIALETTSILSFREDKFSKFVEPTNPQGYYKYYEEKDGKQYYSITGKIKNISEYTLEVKNINTFIQIDKEYFTGQMVVMDTEGRNFYKEIKQGEELDMILIYLVSEEYKRKPTSLNLFLNKDMRLNNEKEIYDCQYIINME